jgi:hypothetical protein
MADMEEADEMDQLLRSIADEIASSQVVSLAISHPLVNLVRNALSLLVHVVSRPPPTSNNSEHAAEHGLKAIKPALDKHPDFLESLVQRLSASDHTLCANALQLVNALMRDAVAQGGEHEWPKFIKRLQDLGVIGSVGLLMRGEAASDIDSTLATAILEFQSLTKVLLRKWKEVAVNVELSEHKRALKTIHLLSKPEPYVPPPVDPKNPDAKPRKHHPEKWRRLGFETESPAWEFDETGYLGIMDLVDYCRRNEDTYQKTLLEQSMQPKEKRCPVAHASLSVTMILYEHFEIDAADPDAPVSVDLDVDVDRLYKPLLLQWGRLHTAALNTFLRLWKDAGAEQEDYYKIEELVRIVTERTLGLVDRKTEIAAVEEDLRVASLSSARSWQMENLDEVYQDAWGPHLVQVREQLHSESLLFMKEQRIRCLLAGAWFPTAPAGGPSAWRYVRLSPQRRWLHHQTFAAKGTSDEPLPLEQLPEKIDLDAVTSVTSNVTSNANGLTNGHSSLAASFTDSNPVRASISTVASRIRDSSETLRGAAAAPYPDTKLTILGTTGQPGDSIERPLLDLHPPTAHLASEWLDGLLMLLGQAPMTKETTDLVSMMEDWGVRLRILNLRWEDVDWEGLESVNSAGGKADVEISENQAGKFKVREVPSRDGLEGEEFWYAMPEN